MTGPPSPWPSAPRPWIAAAVALLVLGMPAVHPASARARGCPRGMSSVRGRYCIDRYEASTVEILPKGRIRRHSPYAPVAGLKVKAVSRKGVKPQAYISRNEAEAACKAAKKRLCTDEEWLKACRGKHPTTYPYGKVWKSGYCNDHGRSSFNHYYGDGGEEAPLSAYTWDNMNDDRLNKLKGTLAPTGAFRHCRSSYVVYDMVGNLHEWTSAPGGTFRGGYYLDTTKHGDGCDYKTTKHSPRYHDYSTGFRCCK